MLAVGLAALLAAAPQQSVAVSQVHDAYQDAFVVLIQPTPTDTFVGMVVRRKLPEQSPLAPLVNQAGLLLTYLLEHGTTFDPDQVLAGPKRQDRLQASLDSALTRDLRFDRLVLPLVAASLSGRHEILVGYPPLRDRPSVSMDSAVAVAARFFYPDSFGPDGHLRSRVCTAVNGLPANPTDRDLFLEAFVFDALRTDLDSGEEFPPLAEYQDTVRATLQALPPMSDATQRINALRSAAWTRLGRSGSLREVLRQRYLALSSILPFRLTE